MKNSIQFVKMKFFISSLFFQIQQEEKNGEKIESVTLRRRFSFDKDKNPSPLVIVE
jgi:hypothetical protein